MDGYLLLADGMRLDGALRGSGRKACGWMTANTSVVGFQEMATDPAYRGAVLAFTYPEIGNVGAAAPFSESCGVQPAALVVKQLNDRYSHYRAAERLETMLQEAAVPCLTDIDTRGVAVHLREAGEMPAAVVPADADPDAVREELETLGRPEFAPAGAALLPEAEGGPRVAVLDLGVRRSQLRQLARICRPQLIPWDAAPEEVLAQKPAGLFVSDGPSGALPPERTVETLRELLGRLPMLGCGLGHVAVGVAFGCKAAFLPRGHHGANYPVRNLVEGSAAVTQQRHSIVLERGSVEDNDRVELVWVNMNDDSVEGIRSADGSAIGFQDTLPAPQRGLVNPHIDRFVEWISGK